MKHRICIILCYFGKLPLIFPLLLESCKENKEIDWLIFSDQDIDDAAPNIRAIRCSLGDIKQLAMDKLKIGNISLERAYKLCDYKCTYPYIFEEYVKQYDFVGYGDTDVVYGKLKHFFTDEILDEFDKIFLLGHLSLIRNSDECVRIFMDSVEETADYRDVYTTDCSMGFDEQRGINEKFLVAGKKVYKKNVAADIDMIYQRMRLRCVDAATRNQAMTNYIQPDNEMMNYKIQVFYHSPEGVLRIFRDKGQWKREEFAYIHYRKKQFQMIDAKDSSYWITRKGMIVDKRLDGNVEDWITIRQVLKLNPYWGMLEKLKFLYNTGKWPQKGEMQ